MAVMASWSQTRKGYHDVPPKHNYKQKEKRREKKRTLNPWIDPGRLRPRNKSRGIAKRCSSFQLAPNW
jgi:hypothetical protein